MAPESSYLIVAAFLVVFTGLWTAAMYLTAVSSGWLQLAKLYRTEQEFSGEKWTWESGQMGWANFRGCLVIGANRQGLYLRVQFPFHFFCAPLFIPWSAVQAVPKKAWFFNGVSFRLGVQRPAELWVRASLAERVRRASL
jgi:hypothetical protein